MNESAPEQVEYADDFARAAAEAGDAPTPAQPAHTMPGPAPPAEPPVQYPPFHPDDWRDNAIAMGINGLADGLAGMPEDTATKDNLGESIAFALDYYTGGKLQNLPPYAHVVISGGKYTFHVVMHKKNSTKDDENDDAAAAELAKRMEAARKGGANTQAVNSP
ncbi:MAG: hypothetical protein QOE90_932 [Thermoplasmata archaeon]|jgi:hypothetical protein|nr:hypothetical protein [Thermoplasmata archaeon]